jgi:hypothetical protein
MAYPFAMPIDVDALFDERSDAARAFARHVVLVADGIRIKKDSGSAPSMY